MEEKQLTSRELEEQANALLAEADFEEINLPKKAKKAAAAKKANEDTAQAEKPAEKFELSRKHDIPRWMKSWSPPCPRRRCCRAAKSSWRFFPRARPRASSAPAT